VKQGRAGRRSERKGRCGYINHKISQWPLVQSLGSLAVLLKGHEHDDTPRSEAHPVGDESLVEGEGAFVLDCFDTTVQHTSVESSTSNGLVHEAILDHIHGGTGNSGEETSGETGSKVGGDTLFIEAGVGNEDTLGLVVCGELGGVHDHGTLHVGPDSLPKADDTFILGCR